MPANGAGWGNFAGGSNPRGRGKPAPTKVGRGWGRGVVEQFLLRSGIDSEQSDGWAPQVIHLIKIRRIPDLFGLWNAGSSV